jgi:pantothenate synthetase
LSNADCLKILAMLAEAQAQAKSERRVLVPTMGALHKVHGELIPVG